MHYELADVLGEGGMGRVVRAIHRPSGLEVAIKTLHPQFRGDRSRRRLLLDEATAAAKLDDPHIVRLLELGHDEHGAPFLVMELARGEPLGALVSRWRGWAALGRALLDVLDGLATAHAAGIVHRDLKPANVVVDPTSGCARILDFGVAAFLDPLRTSDVALVVGTPEYMAPEQLSGNGPIGPWTDLYAFGVMLAEVVRGASPFAPLETLPALFLAKSTRAPTPAPARDGLLVPDALQRLIERLLRPHPRERPRFAAEVARELAALAPLVLDAVPPLTENIERAEWARPTIDDVPPDERVLGPVEPSSVSPAWLPASPDLAMGAGVARLRQVPLVGREDERAALPALVSEVVATRSSRLLAYVGEAGIGKSRLARWGLGYVERTGTMDGAAGAYDISGADVAGGLRHALRRLLGMPRKDVDEAWQWLAGEPGLDLERLLSFLRADDQHDTLATDVVVSLALGALRAVGRLRPIYLWLDDLGWARDGAIEIVERALAEPALPVLFVATMRGGTIQHGGAHLDRVLRHPRSSVRVLGPLSADERARMLDAIVPLEPGLAPTLAARIDGSPLFLEELARDWLARGLLEPSGPFYRPRDGTTIDALLVGRPLGELVTERLAELLAAFGERATAAERVLARAALLGFRFERAALRAACSRDARLARAVDEVLDRALLVGLLRSEGARVYAFDHAAAHEALIERVERSRDRVAALVDAANGLSARYGKERADVASLVARLLHRAGDAARAWDRQLRAIERAAWAGDDRAALAYLEVARGWPLDSARRAAELDLTEAHLHYYALRYDRALPLVASARALAQGVPELALRCDIAEADVLFYLDRLAEAERIAARCHDAAEDEDPDLAQIRSRAAQRLGELSALRGDLDAALRWRELAVEHALNAGSSFRARVCRLNVAEVHALEGRFGEALSLCESVLAEAREERDEDNVTAARETRARIDVLAGRPADARPFLLARLAELASGGDPWRLSGMAAFAALVAAELDDTPELEARAAQLVAAFRTVPHDEAFTLAAMQSLAARLDERGHVDLARAVDALLLERRERHRDGFART